MPVVIDGYNLLWSIQKAGNDFESIDDFQLCRILGRYLKQNGETGEIVFDGTGPPNKSGFDNISNLAVVFVGMNTDADTVIEDKIKASTAPKLLTVVSSDRRLRKAGRVRKTIVVKSELFWGNVRRELSKKKTANEPPEKRRGLNESETKQWLKFFGFEQ